MAEKEFSQNRIEFLLDSLAEKEIITIKMNSIELE